MKRAVGPFCLALAIAAAIRIALPFDGLYGQDAFAYFRFARAIWPHLLHGAPLPALYWPRGYPATVALLLPLVRGPLAGQLVSALAIAWAAAASALLVTELQRARPDQPDPTAAMVAGLCAAASGIALRTSQLVMADGLAIGLTATALWTAARFARTGRGPWLVATAFAIAWGATARWQIGLLALPALAAVLLADRPAPAGAGWWAAALLAALLILGPQLAAAHAVPSSLAQHEWLRRWSPANAWRRDFHTTEGHARDRFPVALFYLLRLGWPDALFPSVGALAAGGAWRVLRGRRPAELALLLGWPLVNGAFIAGIPYENPRFVWPALPCVAALAGLGFQACAHRLGRRGRLLLAAGLAASMAAGLAFAAREHARTVARKNADRAVVAWVDAVVPRGATVWRAGGTLMAEAYGATAMRDVYLSSPADIPSLLAAGCPCYVLENRDDLERQWAGLPPQTFFQALKQTAGLTPVAERPPFVLFRIGPPP
jgi:hypothetical protein